MQLETSCVRQLQNAKFLVVEEVARAYDVGIHYTGKKIPLNFPESVKNLPKLPQGLSWEELAPFVKK
jgi:hypothetical protein